MDASSDNEDRSPAAQPALDREAEPTEEVQPFDTDGVLIHGDIIPGLTIETVMTLMASGGAAMVAREAIRQSGETRRERLRQEGETAREAIRSFSPDGHTSRTNNADDKSPEDPVGPDAT
ncbi:hypothetical protein DQE82_29595 [Micromonospora sp. LHW51205]|uniref:hypothetical protein n=1 Tax=Micromonospora sp. LHW51205 TaxID=2248752 RepID=UPI000E13F5C3|nr:hypothetical protein [Micromonospora sp. LHW51205]RBQ03891.1 hypothetical protein DQE82_29595 [Micromonospora sp. LHW51205]